MVVGHNCFIDMLNWSKRVQEIQQGKTEELKQLANQGYKKPLKELDGDIVDKDRIRFLEAVKSAFEMYIFPGAMEEIEYPAYYILLYHLEQKDFSFTMDQNDKVVLVCNDSQYVRTIVFLIDQFRNSLKDGGNPHSLESF